MGGVWGLALERELGSWATVKDYMGQGRALWPAAPRPLSLTCCLQSLAFWDFLTGPCTVLLRNKKMEPGDQ